MEGKSEGWICSFMDAMPFNLGFELDELRLIEMLPRICAFEVKMTDAAENMLGVTPPHDYELLNPRIGEAIRIFRDGGELECSVPYAPGTLGVLWSWQLILDHKWNWCGVSQNWWETLAVCDPGQRFAILPFQYFRRLARHTGEIGRKDDRPVDHWPEDLIANIKAGKLPGNDAARLEYFF